MASVSLWQGKGRLLMGGDLVTIGVERFSKSMNDPNPNPLKQNVLKGAFPQARHADGNGQDRNRTKSVQKFCAGFLVATLIASDSANLVGGIGHGLPRSDGRGLGSSQAQAAALVSTSSQPFSNRLTKPNRSFVDAQESRPTYTLQLSSLSEDSREGSPDLESATNDFASANVWSDGQPQKETKRTDPCNIRCFRADPVCGKNGVTYWCGAPEAKCAGVEIAYDSKCEPGGWGPANSAIRALQSLFRSFLGVVNTGPLCKL